MKILIVSTLLTIVFLISGYAKSDSRFGSKETGLSVQKCKPNVDCEEEEGGGVCKYYSSIAGPQHVPVNHQHMDSTSTVFCYEYAQTKAYQTKYPARFGGEDMSNMLMTAEYIQPEWFRVVSDLRPGRIAQWQFNNGTIHVVFIEGFWKDGIFITDPDETTTDYDKVIVRDTNRQGFGGYDGDTLGGLIDNVQGAIGRHPSYWEPYCLDFEPQTCPQKPSATNISITKSVDNHPLIEWSESARAESYIVYISTDSSNWYQISNTTLLSLIDANVYSNNPGYNFEQRSIFYKVLAINCAGVSDKSNILQGEYWVQSSLPPLTTPKNFNVSPILHNDLGQTVYLSWTASADPDIAGYEIFRNKYYLSRGQVKNTGFQKVYTTSLSSWSESPPWGSSPRQGIAYHYKIRAINSSQNRASDFTSYKSSSLEEYDDQLP